MRVKVGHQWFECTIRTPLMVELTPADRVNISRMPEDATRYAVFSDHDPRSREECFAWMEHGGDAEPAILKPEPVADDLVSFPRAALTELATKAHWYNAAVGAASQIMEGLTPTECIEAQAARITELQAEVERLRGHIATMHNTVRHELSAEIEASVYKAFKAMSGTTVLRAAALNTGESDAD